MKKIFFGGCIIASILCSCSSKTTNESSKIQTTTIPQSSVKDDDESNSVSSELTDPTNGTDILQKYTYNIHVDTLSADSIYNTDVITMPKTINGYEYSLCGVNDDKIVVQLNNYNSEDKYSEFGLFSPDNSAYEKIFSTSDQLYFLCARENEYVFERISDDIRSLEYYNSETSEFKIMLYLTNELYLNEKSVTFFNNQILFDISTQSDISIYEYNIDNDKTDIFINKAMRPSVNKNNLKYISVNADTNICDKVVDYSDKSEFQLNNNNLLSLICTTDSIFGLTVIYDESSQDALNYFMELIELKDDGKYDSIFSTQLGSGELIESLQKNSFCVSWDDWTGDPSSPCVYDIKQKKMVLFDSLEDCYYSSFLSDKISLIYDHSNFEEKHKVCIFSQK